MQFKPVDLQVINPDLFYRGTRSEKKQILQQLREQAVCYGLVVLWKPDITEADYDPLLDMMERYFAQPMEILQADVRADIGRQVGFMEPHIERSKRYPEIRSKIKPEHQPFVHTGANPHMRFFHRYGPRPMHSAFPERHADPVIPHGFESEWTPKLDHWGAKTLELSFTVSEMLEHAFDLPYGTLVYRMDYAPHVVSPVGCDVLELVARHAKMSPEELGIQLCEASDPIALAEKLGLIGLTISEFHVDFNPMTLHGPARYPALVGYTTRDLEPFVVRVPRGCVLVQFGEQMEYVTAGGLNPKGIQAGPHLVAILKETILALVKSLKEGRSMIRATTTVFIEWNVDDLLEVLPSFRVNGWEECYPPTSVGEHSLKTISEIGLYTI